MTYQPGIPTGSVPLNMDYLNLQGNFTSLSDQWSVDHVSLTSTSGSPPNGYHTNIHLVPNSTITSNPPNNYPPTTPTVTTGYGQVWSAQVNDGINTDESLFFLTGGSRNLQLTMNFVPTNAANGFTFIPGGIIFQWGNSTASGTGIRNILFVTENMNFPTNCYVVIAQPTAGTAGGGGGYIVAGISKTGFNFVSTPSQFPSGTPFNWIAIGN